MGTTGVSTSRLVDGGHMTVGAMQGGSIQMVFVKPRPDEETRRCFPEAGVGRTEELVITGY